MEMKESADRDAGLRKQEIQPIYAVQGRGFRYIAWRQLDKRWETVTLSMAM
ncbi:MAG: hypothetical protein NC123_14575 [Butyrivibrio sp.]|nr:hypothetical protein [Butyrivibrio sp.]